MTSAADTWRQFGEDYNVDGVIAKLSAAARAKIYINPTNDHNEGALGRLRRAIREFARLSLTMHNAKSNTAFTTAIRVWLRGEARRRIDSGRDRKRRQEVIEQQKIAADAKKQAEADRQAKDAARKAELASLIPILDVAEIQANHTRINATEIVKQINWHRQFVEKGVIPQNTAIAAMPKADKVIQLIVAVTRFNQDILPKLQLLSAAMTSGAIVDVEVPTIDEEMPDEAGWEEQEEMEDADMFDDY
ncbi:hypothetical protein B0H13DRAFT_2506017 [Mycena leptocephala]|nr:hypothetical protein B0H13DRAFT_2506017 [Mycena leptocephala]